MPAMKKYDVESQGRAVRMYTDRVAEGDISQLKALEEVGELLGINPSTLKTGFAGIAVRAWRWREDRSRLTLRW